MPDRVRDDTAEMVAWTLTLQDPNDPHGHSARARQRDTASWDVEYFRGDTLVSDGRIGTPPPHAPPFATLTETLREMRREADHGRCIHVWQDDPESYPPDTLHDGSRCTLRQGHDGAHQAPCPDGPGAGCRGDQWESGGRHDTTVDEFGWRP